MGRAWDIGNYWYFLLMGQAHTWWAQGYQMKTNISTLLGVMAHSKESDLGSIIKEQFHLKAHTVLVTCKFSATPSVRMIQPHQVETIWL